MQTTNRVFDDIARLTGGAVGILSGVREEIEARVRQRVEVMLDGMNLVGRDEFEAVKEMAALARAENERLEKRIAALEPAKPDAKPRKTKTVRRKAEKGG